MLLALLGAWLGLAALPLPTLEDTMETMPQPIIIAHRGASGERPEHTLAAYRLAIAQGADFIEPDLVATRDGVLVARHENEISGTTDVAAHPEFADRKRTRTIDGQSMTGWFTEDFTFDELRTLRARERLPQVRPRNTAYDGQEAIPTFDDILDLARAESERLGRPIGVYPETKHPSYFRGIGLPLEPPLLEALERVGWDRADAPVFIQSFEAGNLKALRRQTGVRLIFLMAAEGQPYDFTLNADRRTYHALLDAAGLAEIATFADGIGVEKTLILPRDASGRSLAPTTLVADAHAAGLLVHAWTIRAENMFLPAERRAANPSDGAHGDLAGEIRQFIDLGLDGLFCDFPGAGVAARDASR